MAAQANLDDILNEAMNDYEEAAAKLGGSATSAAVSAIASAGSVPKGDREMQAAIQRMMGDIKDPEFQRALEHTMRDMAVGDGTNGAISGADGSLLDGGVAASVFSSLAAESGATGAETVAKTLEMLHKLSVETEAMEGAATGDGLHSESAKAAEELSDEVISRMMSEFESMGAKEDFGSAVDGMMRQLLSKDIMHEPMRQICERFPAWLAKHAPGLTKAEYEAHGKMYQTFQKLVACYDTEPDNFPRLMELMQDLQELGQPPAEIIRELAPALEMGADGLPMLPNMGAGVPKVPGLPAGACTIM